MLVALLVPPARGSRHSDGPKRVPNWVWVAAAVALMTIVAASWLGVAARRRPLLPGQAVHEALGSCLADSPYDLVHFAIRRLPGRRRAAPASYRVLLLPDAAHASLQVAVLEFDVGRRRLRAADEQTARLLSRFGCPLGL